MPSRVIVKLIGLVEKHPILYDQSHHDYRDPSKKKDVWRKIAQECGFSDHECQVRWRNIRDKYVRETKKIETMYALHGELVECRWPLYTYVRFLEGHIVHRRSISYDTSLRPEQLPSDDDEFTPVVELGTPDETNQKEEDSICSSSQLSISPLPKQLSSNQINSVNTEDADRQFCLSLLPYFRSLTSEIKSIARIQIQQILHNLNFVVREKDKILQDTHPSLTKTEN